MGIQCSICKADDRENIERALVAGTPYRTIRTEYGVGISALSRHQRAGHISPALIAMKAASDRDDRAAATTMLQRLEEQYVVLAAVVADARKDGSPTTIINASREMRQTAEVLAKITGELNERPVTVNLLSSPEILAALNVIYDELRDQPEIRQRIAARLQPERLQIEAAR